MKIRSRPTPFRLLTLCLLLAAGCFRTHPVLESISLTCPERLEVDRTVKPIALGRYLDGRDRTFGISLSSSDESVATINDRGYLTTLRPGTVVVRAEKDGIFAERTLTVVPVFDGLKIHFRKPPDWREPNVYIYQGFGATTELYTGAWPGTRMIPEGDGWYVFVAEGIPSSKVIFNDGNVQDPRPQSSGFERRRGEWWYDGAAWHEAHPSWMDLAPAEAD